MKITKQKLITIVVFLGIFSLAAFFRLYGINWDQNQHLHPDERFLTMVAGSISWPSDLWEYLDTGTSPANPHNRGYGFYVYGTFPLFFTKWVAELVNKGDYVNLTIVGRQLSAVFDLGTVILVFLIGKQILKSTNSQINKFSNKNPLKLLDYLKLENWRIGLFAAFFYAASVLPIQLSHFFAVDTYLTFFITLSFYLLIKIIKSHNSKTLNSKLEYRNSKQYQISNVQNSKPSLTWLKQFELFGFRILNLFRASDFGFRIYPILLGISFGLAIASKISAIYFLPIILIGLIISFLKSKKLFLILNSCFLILIFSYITIRLAQPYLFAQPDLLNISLNPKVVENWKQLKSFDNPNSLFPPAVQWIKTKPYIFPLKNMLFWGLGLPLGIIAVIGIISQILNVMLNHVMPNLFRHPIETLKQVQGDIKKSVRDDNKKIDYVISLSLLWILIVFFYQGNQFAKAIRYFYPIYPFLTLLSGWFLVQYFQWLKKNIRYKFYLLSLICCLLSIVIYPLSFISIYSHPHSRIQASEWIYNNIPNGSKISGEHWDDFLPLRLPDSPPISYTSVELPLYNADTKAKWVDMADKLKQSDYIVLSSSRLYGSIMTVPEKFPVTNRYYQALFDGSLGFMKVAEFTSRPNIPIPFIKLCLTPPYSHYGIISYKSQQCNDTGISFVDDYADEVFTVYDHPKVIIFKKTKQIDFYNFLFGNYQPQTIN